MSDLFSQIYFLQCCDTCPRLSELDPDSPGGHHQQLLATSATKKKGVKSFCIDDILSHKTAALRRDQQQTAQGIVRPWDRLEGRPAAESQSQGAAGGRDGRRKSVGDSPLDALFNMATNFEALKAKSGRKKLAIYINCFFLVYTKILML